jgi:hypothetical protein
MPGRASLARRVGFAAAVMASAAGFGSSLAGIAQVEGDLQRAERAPVIAAAERSDRRPASPALESYGAEHGQRFADCPERDHRVDRRQARL